MSEQAQVIKHTEQTIGIGCPPGFPRPDDLIAGVIEGTGLPTRHHVFIFFGDAEWDYSDIDPALWEKANPIIRERIEALYAQGVIRYGSW